MIRFLGAALVMLLMMLGPDPAVAGGSCGAVSDHAHTSVGLPDHQWSGNRVVWPWSCEPFEGVSEDVELDTRATWVVAHPADPGNRWILTSDDGRACEFDRGQLAEVPSELMRAEPPAATMEDGRLRIAPRAGAAGPDPIPHGRPASSGSLTATLAGPTERYPHGVLGDGIEASALAISADDGSESRVELPEHEVIEGISAIVALFGDGIEGSLVTVSDAELGARLRLYAPEGDIIAGSEPIGQGFRWLHQIGVGPTGPDGELEIIAVRTPHIGGVVEAYQLDGDRLERVAAIDGYSSHVIGSANLDMALLADTDADGQLEIVVPTQAMTELAVLERTEEGFAEVMRLPLEGRLASNVAAAVGRDGRLSLAVATDDGRLRIFR